MSVEGSIQVTLPDGSKREFKKGTTLLELAASLGRRFEKNAVAAIVDDQKTDLSHQLQHDAKVSLILSDAPEALEIVRHSAAHIMAGAVKDLFPAAKVTIGPSVDDGVNGFYYDFDFERGFKDEDLLKITERMKEVIAKDLPFVRKESGRTETKKLFEEAGETYKVELLEAIPEGEAVSLYQHGDFLDLCRGPHLPSTGKLKAFRLMSVAGAYWRGDSSKKMLARIYGTAFSSQKELDEHVARVEDAKKRDHRILGKQLDLFSFSPSVGGGLVLWHPKGAKIRSIIEEFWRQSHAAYGYDLVYSPHIGRAELWERSGHLGFYRKNMYSPMEIEGNPFYVKPMNCPFHIEIYRNRLRSYRDLPMRLCELGTVYRFEASGVLHGLLRVRGFTQDDAHIFCREDQLDAEIRRCLDLTFFLLRSFGFEKFDIYLSTRPEKFVGEPGDWEKATKALSNALEEEKLPYQIDPGEGVFYGPKIDIKIRDGLGRTWQCTTIQVDFQLPHRFEMEFVDRDNRRAQPFMLHRALLGSMERFFGVLLEHHAGAFPLWLAPTQAVVLPVSDDQNPFARDVVHKLVEDGIRATVDDRNEKLSFKIREAQLEKVPYMLVVGKREVEQNGVSPRTRAGKDLGLLPIQDVLEMLKQEAAWPKRPPIKEV
jgi:threonyl-tRNA synthetase